MKNEMRCMFSMLMCVYNSVDLLDTAIGSLLCQGETSWELLILDNSDTNQAVSWPLLEDYAKKDSRIQIFQSSKNVGWAKGSALLLQNASGKYVSFLAADDFLLPDALAEVRKKIDKEDPEIVWVGNGFYQYMDGNIENTGKSVLPQSVVIRQKSASNIRFIMEHTFFNSMFHYTKIDFLKDIQVDFYEPYYGDCVGMTKALTEAEKMVILDFEVYGLVSNTSQTRGKYSWDCEQYIFNHQWECIKEACVRDGFFSFQDMRYCSMAIVRSHIANIYALLNGCVCMDKDMNPLTKTFSERFLQLKKVLEDATMHEMIQFYDRFGYEKQILDILLTSCRKYPDANSVLVFETSESGWLGSLLELKMYTDCTDREKILKKYLGILTDDCNTGMLGIGEFLQYVNGFSEIELADYINQIQIVLKRYEDWKNVFVSNLFAKFRERQPLKGQSRVELAACCKYFLNN